MKRVAFLTFIFTSGLALGQTLDSLQVLTARLNSSSSSNCSSVLNEVTEKILALQDDTQIKVESLAQGDSILKSLFDLREMVRTKTTQYPITCIDQAKRLMTASRALGDLVGVYSSKIKQIKSEELNFQKQPIPLQQNAPSYKTMGEALPQFQSGDLMITKGVSFVSSTISKISRPASVFSHIVFVHRDNQKIQTIESYIGDGVKLYEMPFALRNENARILLLRSKDQTLASKADSYIYNRVKNEKIKYDYELDFVDNKKLSCEEIAYDAYMQASAGQMKIPKFPASIQLRDPDFAESLGLKNGQLMAPADMDLDPRFQVVSDWTDLRLMRDSWRKDMVLSEIFRWMNQLEYNFVNDLGYIGLKMLLGLRHVPLFGEKMSQWLSVSSDAPNSALVSLDRIRTVGSVLLAELEKQDVNHFQQTGLWMSQRQLQQSLENFRKKDRNNYLDPNSSSIFHQYLREDNLVAQ